MEFALGRRSQIEPGLAELLKRIEVRLVRAIWRRQRREARRLGVGGALRGGGVCFWQWFGSSLQLTPHLLVPDSPTLNWRLAT